MNKKIKPIKIGNIYGCTGGNFAGNIYDIEGISPCINTFSGGNREPMIIEYEYTKDFKAIGYTRDKKGKVVKRHLMDYVNTIHTSTGSGNNTDCFIMEIEDNYRKTNFGNNRLNKVLDDIGETDELLFLDAYNLTAHKNIASTIKTTISSSNMYFLKEPQKMEQRNFRIRKLTPRECFRLQGVGDKDIDTIQSAGISNSQKYKLAGNSIVVDVLDNVFENLFYPPKGAKKDAVQLTLF